jgi:MFS superfamily sulfate permease-like transporter
MSYKDPGLPGHQPRRTIMSIGSFAIGVLTMIVFAIVIAIVMGVLKVTSLAKEMLTMKKRQEDMERSLFTDINMVEQTLRNQINRNDESMHHVLDDSYRMSTAYTDKRIDKLVDTYFEMKKNTKKDLLKD